MYNNYYNIVLSIKRVKMNIFPHIMEVFPQSYLTTDVNSNQMAMSLGAVWLQMGWPENERTFTPVSWADPSALSWVKQMTECTQLCGSVESYTRWRSTFPLGLLARQNGMGLTSSSQMASLVLLWGTESSYFFKRGHLFKKCILSKIVDHFLKHSFRLISSYQFFPFLSVWFENYID